MPIRFAYAWVTRILLLMTLLLCIFNEFLVYHFNSATWQQIDCHFDNCTRILLIADPQLLGVTYDKSIYSGLARYDSDRYLHSTFKQALQFTQPHVICFLGDLFDEGNVASPEQFGSYVERFRNIYKTEDDIRFKMISPLHQLVHVPGDNDIGGENGEYISNLNLQRFEEAFTQRDIMDYNTYLRFFKINRMILDFTNPDRAHNSQKLRIGLSHVPILIGGGPLLRSVLKELDPHVIFSGHWHESRIFLYPTRSSIFYETAIKHYNLKQLKEQQHTFLEIMVPTSSYRMGKVNIGIGYAVLENYDLHYTVLWLPNRFLYLCLYAFWLLFAFSIHCVFRMMKRCPFRKFYKSHPRYQRISDEIS